MGGPLGVASLVGTVGEEYCQAYLIVALVPEREFNLQLTHYYEDPEDDSDSLADAGHLSVLSLPVAGSGARALIKPLQKVTSSAETTGMHWPRD